MKKWSTCQQCGRNPRRYYEVGDGYCLVDDCPICGDANYTVPLYGTEGWVWGG